MTSERISPVWGTILLTITILSLSLPAYAKYSGGTGEPNDPYQIATADDLMLLGETPEDYDKHFILTADIDLDPNLPGRKVFNKAVISSLRGSFDGAGHTISHLTVHGGTYLGLFGELRIGAEVRNLGVTEVNMDASDDYVGAVVGVNGGTVTGCYSTGAVRGRTDVGGLLGDNWGTVAQCYSTCAVSGGNGAGGLMGANSNGVVSNCYSSGPVEGADRRGGLVAYNQGIVIQCFWDTQASGQTESAAGTGKTTAEMQTASTFLEEGWDFVDETANGTEDIWKISEGLGYPRLWWEKYSGGTGEPNDPYQIATAADLIALGETPEDYDKHFILTADIDLDPNLPGGRVFDKAVIAPDTDAANWRFQGTPFAGVFDGKGHTISRLTIEGGSYLGLLGQVGAPAVVSNLFLEAVDVNGTGEFVGGLVGSNLAIVSQCCCTAIVRNAWWVGALVGFNDGSVTQCYSASVVTGVYGLGGLVGLNNGVVTYCYSTGSVSGNQSVGGLVGSNQPGSSISDCYSTGTVSGEYDVGGLIGLNGRYAADYDGPDGVVTHCYSTGPVSGPAGHVGGLVGFDSEVGVLVFDCFWDLQTSGQGESGGGTGKRTADMQDPNTFTAAGWDLVDEMGNGTHEVWQMPAGGGYPVLAVLSGHAPHQLQGSGLRDTPYLIYDALDLGAISRYSPDAHYRLAAPIDLSEIRWSVPVIPSFAGTFDGHGYTISHLRIEGREGLGLFGRLERGGRIVDLGVVDVNITGSSNIGSLVANNSGDLTRCYCSGVVDCNWGRYRALYEWGYVVGGMVGRNDGTVTQCCSTSLVSGHVEVGGLVGRNGGTVTQCQSTSTVIGDRDVGGLVGESYGLVSQCYSTGAVDGNDDVGGLVGGNLNGDVIQCYSTGTVSGRTYVGGLLGGNLGGWSVTASFWDIQTSGQATSDGGTGKTTPEMQTASTFLDAGWDFVGETVNGTEDIWWILEGKDYPRLWWEGIER
jgi:hypothetical protein